MKKTIITRIMAVVMAILCVVGTMPAVSVKADEQASVKDTIKITVELTKLILEDAVVADGPEYLPLFTVYSDADTLAAINEELNNMLAILDTDKTDEEYEAAYEAYKEKMDKLYENCNIKVPSRAVLKELINGVKSFYKNVDKNDEFNDVEPGKIWLPKDVRENLEEALKTAENLYNTTTDADEASEEVYNSIYSACVDLEDAYNEVVDKAEKKACTVADVKKILDGLKDVSSREKIKIYDTAAEAEADNAVYYVLKETQDSAKKAISVIEEKLSSLTDDDTYNCEITYNYAKRALNRYLNGIVSMPEKDVTITEEIFANAMALYAVVLDEDYLRVVLSDDEASYGDEYVYIDAMNEYEAEYNRVKALYDNRDKVACDYNQLYIDMQTALIKLRGNIKYKETTKEDLDKVLANAASLKNQLDDTYETKEQIKQEGKKGKQYVLKSDMAKLNAAIEDVKNDMDNLPTDEIEREYYIMADVVYLNSYMTDLMSKIRVVNADNDDLNNIIDLSEAFLADIYEADSFEEVPEGKLWIPKEAVSQMKEYIDNAKAALSTDDLTAKNKAYNALSTVLSRAKDIVKKGAAVVTPEKDTDNSNSSNAAEKVDTPQTGDASGVYAYIFVAALSAAVLTLAAENRRKVRK